MDFKDALSYLRSGLDLAEKAVPIAASFGIPQTNVAAAFIEIAQNLVERTDDGSVALASNDIAELKAILAKLQAVNDPLAAEIDAS